jgi:hypothetical protein
MEFAAQPTEKSRLSYHSRLPRLLQLSWASKLEQRVNAREL